MHTLIEQLLQYHHKSSQTVGKLSQTNKELIAIGPAGWRESLIEILDSMHGKAEINHHFNEEIIREMLMRTEAPIHRHVEQIAKDHEAFDRILSNLRNDCRDTDLSPEELSSNIDDFIHKYYDHMEAEEAIFFPMADKWLNDEDWETVQKKWRGDLKP